MGLHDIAHGYQYYCPLLCRFISQVGTVEPKEQRKTLFGEESDALPAQTLSSTAPSPGSIVKED